MLSSHSVTTVTHGPRYLLQLQAWENRIQLLEEKIASLKAVSGRVDASVSITRSNQTHYLSVQVRPSTDCCWDP